MAFDAGVCYAIQYRGGDSLWVGADSGLILMNTRTGRFNVFKNDPKDTTSLSGPILSVLVEKSGDIWAGCYFGGGLIILIIQQEHSGIFSGAVLLHQ
jgi:hypothetical protein